MQATIENMLKELLEKMHVPYENITSEIIENNRYRVNLSSPQSSLLIGYNGTTLKAIEHLLNIFIKKDTENETRIFLDIANYRKRQEDSIVNMVIKKAEMIEQTSRPQILLPMSSYYRRIVHLYVADHLPKLITESIGEGERRQVVIKLKDN